jgi:hypothetical protein
MPSNVTPPNPPLPRGRLLRRAYSAIRTRGYAGLSSIARTSKDPTLPLLVLGAIGAAFVAALVFNAPPEIVFGILFIGGLTAFLETKMHNDNRDR